MRLCYTVTFMSVAFLTSTAQNSEDIKNINYNKGRKELVGDVYKSDSRIKSLEVYEGNEPVSKTFFDESGKVTEFINEGIESEGYERTVHEYGMNGKLICEKSYSENGKMKSITNYEYDIKGSMKLKTCESRNGKEKEIQALIYDGSGRLTEDKMIQSDGSEGHKIIYKYGDKGNVTEEWRTYKGETVLITDNIYDDSGRIAEIKIRTGIDDKSISEHYVYEYEGRLKSMISLNPAGGISYTESYFYDGSGRLSSVIFKSDITSTKENYKYDLSGNLTEIESYENGKFDGKKLLDYNNDGNVTLYRIYDKNNKLTIERKREYDSKGNLKSDISDNKQEGKSVKFYYIIKYY